MSEPILCEYLLRLATDAPTRDRFKKLSQADRKTFLINLGLELEAARALAEFDEGAIKKAVDAELHYRGGFVVPPHHTIQLSVDIVDSLTTQKK